MTTITFYDGASKPVPLGAASLTWPEIVDFLTSPVETGCWPCPGKKCPKKDVQGWSPVILKEAHRLKENVIAITVAAFDLDVVSLDAVEKFDLPGIAHVIHSTHSHRPPDMCSVRIVMPVSRPIAAAEWLHVFHAIIQTYKIPSTQKQLDECKNLDRFYYLPTHAEGGPDFYSRVREGGCIDVDAMLNVELAPTPPVSVERPAVRPVARAASSGSSSMMSRLLKSPGAAAVVGDAEDREVDLGALRKKVVELRRSKASSVSPSDHDLYLMLGRVLEGKAFAAPGGTKHAELPSGRDTCIHKVVSALVYKFGADANEAAVQEILRPSLADMDHTPWDFDRWKSSVSRSFERALEAKQAKDAAEAKERSLNLGFMERLRRARQKPPQVGESQSSDSGSGGAAAGAEVVSEDPDAWMQRLITRSDGMLKACGENVMVILTQPALKGVFRWNELEKRIDVFNAPWASPNPKSVEYDSLLAGEVVDWLQRECMMTVAETLVGSRMLRIAVDNAYNPLHDYLKSLVWDRKPRVDRFLIDYCNARTTDLAGRDITEHVCRVSKCFFIAGAARGIKPGEQVDTVLVLESKGGKGKTSAFRVLGGEWSCETAIELGDKDSKMLAASSWIVELGELVSLRKSEAPAHKAFLTTRVDKYRPPYGRSLASSPRMCVFVGSTNEDEYLTDRTGNRRYHPVALDNSKKIDVARIAEDRDQLWAEAVHRYLAGERWWLSDEEELVAADQAEARLAESVTEIKIASWWYGLKPEARPASVTTNYVAERVLMLSYEKIQSMRGIQTEIGIALKRMGFERIRYMSGGFKLTSYVPSDDLRTRSQVKSGDDRKPGAPTTSESLLRVLQGGKAAHGAVQGVQGGGGGGGGNGGAA